MVAMVVGEFTFEGQGEEPSFPKAGAAGHCGRGTTRGQYDHEATSSGSGAEDQPAHFQAPMPPMAVLLPGVAGILLEDSHLRQKRASLFPLKWWT